MSLPGTTAEVDSLRFGDTRPGSGLGKLPAQFLGARPLGGQRRDGLVALYGQAVPLPGVPGEQPVPYAGRDPPGQALRVDLASAAPEMRSASEGR